MELLRVIPAWAVIVALAGHWLFDFVFQPDWMAQRKSSSWWVLLGHSLRIALGAALAAALIVGLHRPLDPRWWPGPLFIGVNGISHFAIDAVTSRLTGRYWRAERRHAFFVMIGFDQLLHDVVILLTLIPLVHS